MQLAAAAELLENAVEAVAQGVEHMEGGAAWARDRGLVYRAWM
jgi:hypothetical protein